MYGGVFCLVIVVFVTCCCNKGGNVCNVMLLLLGVGQAGLSDIFLSVVLELIAVSIVTEIVCLAFLVFSCRLVVYLCLRLHIWLSGR